MDGGEGGLEGAGGPVALQACDLAAGEELAHHDRAAVGLSDQQAADVDGEDVGARGGEAAALGLEEVGDVAAADLEADLGEGGLVPEDLGARQGGDAGGRLEPGRLLGIAVVVADAAVAIGLAAGDDAGAGKSRAVDAVGRLAGAALRAVSRDRGGSGGGRGGEQARQQERRQREQRYVFCAVSSSVMRLKNWSSIILETPPSMRWPTLAMSPPTCTSAL